MSTNHMNKFVIMLYALLIASAVIGTCRGYKITRPLTRRHVRVENGLSHRNLSVHCQSKDNDLNTQFLTPGRFFAWKFTINFGGTTLYWCDLWWEFAHKSFQAFAANGIQDDPCGPKNQCWWNTSEYGITRFSSKTGTWVYMYEWDRNNI